MKIMRKLLGSLGDVWNTLPKDVPMLRVQRGTGKHTLLTIAPGMLYLHSTPFRSDLPSRQEIVLDGLTMAELIATISGMGYHATLTSEAIVQKLNIHSPHILIEIANVSIHSPATLHAYTSKLWKTMYPIYRVLEKAERDIDVALRQLYRDVASGDWLDFWASFFSISREPGEVDNDFIRRFTMWLFNPKTNNIALRELLAYTLKDNTFELTDTAPNQFSITASIKYLNPDYAAKVQAVMAQAKAAGVEYFLSYAAEPYAEDYRLYWADATGKSYNQNDNGIFKLQKAITESAWPAPVDLRTATTMRRVLAEAYTAPSDVQGIQIFKPNSETIWPSPSEALGKALQLVYNDSFAVPTELSAMIVKKPFTDEYTGFSEEEQSNIDSCFTLNDTELRGDGGELLETRYNGLKDVASMTLTKAGVVVSRYIV